MTRPRYLFVPTESNTDWTWLLRVPVKAGEPIPFEIVMMYHANTLLPMQRKQQDSELPSTEVADDRAA